MTRRSVLAVGVAALSLASAAAAAAKLATFPVRGCSLYNSAGVTGASSQFNEMTQTSGDPRFDQVLGVMLVDLSRKFGVNPGFGFYDDSAGLNAWATPQTTLPDSQGTVAFGRGMLAKQLQDPHGDIAVMGICAHEFGHIVDFFTPGAWERLHKDQANDKLWELHADFLSGHYIGLRDEKYSPDELITLGHAWEGLGDTLFTDRIHHGTPEERLSAIEEGFRIARDRPEYKMAQVYEIGARYLGA